MFDMMLAGGKMSMGREGAIFYEALTHFIFSMLALTFLNFAVELIIIITERLVLCVKKRYLTIQEHCPNTADVLFLIVYKRKRGESGHQAHSRSDQIERQFDTIALIKM
uniref:Ion transport domain-containing protein n=1 Tax=Glossina austeni TaxID=7395 RepID=A0A1A9VKZ1_GLOAU